MKYMDLKPKKNTYCINFSTVGFSCTGDFAVEKMKLFLDTKKSFAM